MSHPLLEGLNDPQKLAVTAKAGHHLVLAGAGSGKTRVLTHRIAWLIEVDNVSPFEILAVSFTNKAAHQMRERIESLRGFPSEGLWMGTFHSICHRLLRLHFRDAGLLENFQIIDSSDQARLIKRILKDLGIAEDKYSAKQVQGFINQKKEEGLRARHIEPFGKYVTETLITVYESYESQCDKLGLVDFSELLLRTVELFRQQEMLIAQYRRRFKHILVDEFQDTNALQYSWLKLLVGDETSLMIVGDDDQSIYGWRGARIENILQFQEEYPNVAFTRLEQNYRSTESILKAANAVIANNGERLGKNLWTHQKTGDPIYLYPAFNDLDEAAFIAQKIEAAMNKGDAFSDIAILYRSNAQSRVLEEALIKRDIPYRVYGGLRFFERAEIKDVLAYLRLMFNSKDNTAFERIVNNPPRGIGERSLELLREYAKNNNTSLWESISPLILQLPARAGNALASFAELIESLQKECATLPLHQMIEKVIARSGLLLEIQKEGSEKAQMRLENLEELVTAGRQFSVEAGSIEEAPASFIQDFLAHTALESGEGEEKIDKNVVQLMTLHTAKGLEFPIVFLSGVEEGLFPHYMSVDSEAGLEEERRLCYVGITRAMRELYITYAEVRRLHGKEEYHMPSRFIREIPEELLSPIRASQAIFSKTERTTKTSAAIAALPSHSIPFQLGDSVRHTTFGAGVVLNYEGLGEHQRIQIKFRQSGTKWLMVNRALLKKE